jgi:hypothetical protein
MQVDVSLCERLQQIWVDGILATVKEDHRRYDRKLAEHEVRVMTRFCSTACSTFTSWLNVFLSTSHTLPECCLWSIPA